jgi:hypothetical protein
MTSVRSHPQWFFRRDQFDGRETIALLMDEALAHGSKEVAVRQIDGWWTVTSAEDWLGDDLAAFYALVPDPSRGVNTSRIEVVLTAFCESVWTSARGAVRQVAGTVAPPPLVAELLDDESFSRAIAFLPPADPHTIPPSEPVQSRHLRVLQGDLSARYDELLPRFREKLRLVDSGGDEA